jgi:hypothetical protein
MGDAMDASTAASKNVSRAVVGAVKTGGQRVAEVSTWSARAVADTAIQAGTAATAMTSKAADTVSTKAVDGLQAATQARRSAVESAGNLLNRKNRNPKPEEPT